ncbi:hypothetical protein QBC37DRAFT_298226 [Rhypophila decipiens]|uniref:DUF676 domain-containing protein n=1 Tax=Rhypophila decipiens TaxID=261697 RepID=A0AAN6XVH3_9PEZI|nr:hypothetical protein QBC37DRAFT_298226 [Rhypophila decipiens]
MTITTSPTKRTSSFEKLIGRLSPSSTFNDKTTSKPTTDSNPYGIKVLYNPSDPIADVIFVHGIKGHREQTWSQGSGGPPWPQTLLPLRMPDIRIMTFGYDANPIAWRASVSVNRIGDHSKNLLAALARHRQDKQCSAHRPIIFVAHSLGGLVCKDALLTSRSSADERLRRIYECTRGILFLGTPHTGASLATAAHRLARVLSLTTPKSNLRILRVLEKDSEVLARIQTEFYTILQTRPALHVSCFYEELKYPGLGDVIVSTDSAVLPGYTGIGIHAHHRDMARFETEDSPGFDAVVGELQQLVNELAASVSNSAAFVNGETGGASNRSASGLPSKVTSRMYGDGGIEIWGDVIKSNVVNGNQIVHGDLTFNGS